MHPDGIFYPSHFWLPEQKLWIVIKGSEEDSEPIDTIKFEEEAQTLSAHMNGEYIYTFFGQIPVVEDFGSLDYGDIKNDSGHLVYAFPKSDSDEEDMRGGFDHCHNWCECPECGSLDVQYGGRAARNGCGCLEGDKGNNCGSTRLSQAYEIARQAMVDDNELCLKASGVVYLLQAGPYYKIGKSKDPRKRIPQIKLHLPYEVKEVHVIKTDNETRLERHWHQHFADKRAAKGEWFLLTDKEVEEFKSKSFMLAP